MALVSVFVGFIFFISLYPEMSRKPKILIENEESLIV